MNSKLGRVAAQGATIALTRFVPSGPDRILLHETDGSAAGVPGPSRSRAPRRISRRTASCIPNTSGESGRPRAGTETPIAYKYVGWPGSGSAFFDQSPKGLFDIGETGVERRAPRVEDDVPLRADFRAMQAKRRAEAPLNTIAHHRSADRARHGKSEPGACDKSCARSRGFARWQSCSRFRGVTGFRTRPRPAEGSEQGTRDAKALVIGGAEFGGAQDPGRSGKSRRGAGCGFNWRSGRLSHR